MHFELFTKSQGSSCSSDIGTCAEMKSLNYSKSSNTPPCKNLSMWWCGMLQAWNSIFPVNSGPLCLKSILNFHHLPHDVVDRLNVHPFNYHRSIEKYRLPTARITVELLWMSGSRRFYTLHVLFIVIVMYRDGRCIGDYNARPSNSIDLTEKWPSSQAITQFSQTLNPLIPWKPLNPVVSETPKSSD